MDSAVQVKADQEGEAMMPDPHGQFTVPESLHWLGDRNNCDLTKHARDKTGCVLYFNSEDECHQFMDWLGQRAIEPAKTGKDRDKIETLQKLVTEYKARAIEVASTSSLSSTNPVSRMSHELTQVNALNRELRDARLLLEANGYMISPADRGTP